jgi:RHS repeat-associated protein
VGAQANYYRYNPDSLCVQEGSHYYTIDPNAALSRVLVRDGVFYVWGANGLEYEINGNGTKTYHADHLGSTMLLTADDGGIVATFEYDSYGNPAPTNSNITPFRWHGTLGVITSDNGLLTMRSRVYNSKIMRFLTADKIGFAGGLNHFAAFSGDPVSKTDPLGLCSENIVASSSPFFQSPISSTSSSGPITISLAPVVQHDGPQLGDLRISEASVIVQSAILEDINYRKAITIDFIDAITHDLSPASFTTLPANPWKAAGGIRQFAEYAIDLGYDVSQHEYSASLSGAGKNLAVQAGNLFEQNPAYGFSSYSKLTVQVYLDMPIFFGLFGTRNEWVDRKPIITRHPGPYMTKSEAANAAAQTLQQQREDVRCIIPGGRVW